MPVGLAREYARQAVPEGVLGYRRGGVEHVGQTARVEVDAEHGGPPDNCGVARIEGVDARHGRGADALGKLVAVAGSGRREQVLQELGAPA